MMEIAGLLAAQADPVEFIQLLGHSVPSVVFTEWILMAVILVACWLGVRNMQLVPVSRVQLGWEMMIEALVDTLLVPIMGEKMARKYFPFLATLFLFILASNYSGLIPGFGYIPGLKSPTSNVNIPATLAVTVFLLTQVVGVMERGWGYFTGFLKPFPIMLPLNVLEQFLRPLSLAMRLFGNVFGEEKVIAITLSLVPLLLPVPLMMLSLFIGLIQAVIFAVLTAFYIADAAEGMH